MEKVKKAVDIIKWYCSDGYTLSAIQDFLCDGESLKKEGYGDEDKEVIEIAYYLCETFK